MPQRLEHLRRTVEQLEAELEDLDNLDDETRVVLEEALAEIQQTLDRQNPHQPPPETVVERLQHTAKDFEASHPRVSMLVGRIVHALGQLGI